MLFMRFLARWPLGLLHAIGAALGWLVWALSPTYRRRLAANARIAGLQPGDVRGAVAAAGRMVAEVPWVWLRTPGTPLGSYLQWADTAWMDAQVARARPILLLTPHMGSFEVCARAWAERYGKTNPLTALYRPAKQAWLRTFQETARRAPGLHTAPASVSGVRLMLRALKRGEVVGLLPDQVPPEGQGVWAPFFGLPAYTMTLAARLVQQTGALPIVLRGERLPHGRGWRIHATPLVAELPAASSDAALAAGAAIINQTMEHTILTDPSQYLWAYNRYKQPRAVEPASAVSAAGEDTPR